MGGRSEITFEKQGYPAHTARLQANLDGWYVGNLIFGGLIGLLIVDPATGAMFKLPEEFAVDLNHSTAGLTVMSIDNLSEEQKSKLISLN